jgi:hypothetical protein
LPNIILGRRLRGRVVRVELKQVQARGVKVTVSAAERLGITHVRIRKI